MVYYSDIDREGKSDETLHYDLQKRGRFTYWLQDMTFETILLLLFAVRGG